MAFVDCNDFFQANGTGLFIALSTCHLEKKELFAFLSLSREMQILNVFMHPKSSFHV